MKILSSFAKNVDVLLRRATLASVVLGMISLSGASLGQEIQAPKVTSDLKSADKLDLKSFASATEATISLMAQPMAVPRPKVSTTDQITVKAIHNGTTIAFLLTWKDTEASDAGPLGKFSDAVAIQFPVKDNANPPPIFMGAKDNPVHIWHWRMQYQIDKERGQRTIKDIYPNMSVDMYPMEFPNINMEGVSDAQREVYSYGKAAGNPQSYVKKGVDEMLAEGFGSSSVIENVDSDARGVWKDGLWQVVITRPLQRENGSVLTPGQNSAAGFAVWQGGKDEVGSRKSLTMAWTPLILAK
jgi:Ethylbenzene dehydrogenase